MRLFLIVLILFSVASMSIAQKDTYQYDEGEIYKVVEKMPKFPGCKPGSEAERKACAMDAMLEFIYTNITYPKKARKKGIQGMVVIRFIVDEKGKILKPEIVREIGGGCGKEALKIVKAMPNWEPGYQRGKPVKVQFNLPIKFALSD